MRRALAVLTLVLGTLCAAWAGLVPSARAAEPAFEPPPPPTEWVTDNAGLLREATRSELASRLSAYADASGHQVLVWIGDTTGDVPLEDFTVKSFERWKVGRKGIDDGVVLFLFAKDRKGRIEVGYGLEDKIPDAAAGRIMRDTIVARMRAGDPDGAVTSGVEAIVARLGGTLPEGRAPPAAQRAPSFGEVALIFIGLLVVIIFLATHPSLAGLLLMSFFSGRGRGGFGGGYGGGGFGGGGGFSGGGGSSGGGGASGSW